MRSARTLLAAATATAALAIAAPGAYASSAGDWDKDDHSYSSGHEYKKDEHKDAGGEHDKPKGGVHTGGGLLATVGGDDGDKKDHEYYKDEDKKDGHEYKKDEYKDAGGEHDKPKGGVHTGGGLLATVGGDDGDKKDHEYYKDGDKKDEYKDAGGEHDKPKGGVHTGGGGLAPSGSSAAGGLALLGGLGVGAYVLRRRIARGAA
ncbi:hypothetical protein [Streptomyces glaucescens]|uniref:hypothetical protein n=1 Tax=Streptomyces glaucescens TaxID=1907 RepID=UPI000A35F9C9|nr:hypothetical protein [Streptomyces glaucescens]